VCNAIGLPNQIGTLWRHLMLQAELASSVCAIHLKPIVAAVSRNQSEVVQNRTAKSGFLIDHRTAEPSDSKATENICSKTMSAEKLGRTRLQQVDSGTTQRRIRNCDTGYRFQTCHGHNEIPYLGEHSFADEGLTATSTRTSSTVDVAQSIPWPSA
jgi:hypothetical protein